MLYRTVNEVNEKELQSLHSKHLKTTTQITLGNESPQKKTKRKHAMRDVLHFRKSRTL